MVPPEDTRTDGGGDSGDIPKVRTFKHDVAETIKAEGASVISIAVQQENKRDRASEQTDKTSRVARFFVIAATTLFGLGVAAFVYVYFVYEPPAAEIPAPANELPEPLLPAEVRTMVEIDIASTQSLYENIVRRVSAAGLKLGTLEEIVPVKKIAGANGPVLASAEEFMLAAGIRIPERLARFIEKRFMFGIYTLQQTGAFMIIKPVSFGTVFAELLAWEKDMPAVLYPLLSGLDLPDELTGGWQDEVIRNIDARVFRTKAGEPLMLYGFLPSKDMLIIAANIDTFTEAILRSQTPKPTTR